MLRTIQSIRLRTIAIYRHPSSLHRSLHTSTRLSYPPSEPEPESRAPKPHNADSYFKDVDETAPEDPTVYRVDATSEAVQRPYEPPSGQWSQAGVRTSEYEHVSKDEPYDVSDGQAKGRKLRYGGVGRLGSEGSRPGEGPEGRSKGGRGPE